MDLSAFLEKVVQFGFEYFHIYYGVYRGMVVDNADPEDRGRIKFTAPGAAVMQAPNLWVPPVGFFGAGTSRGWFWPPEIGDSVWIAFSQGNTRYPLCYFPGFFGQRDNATEVPTELRPDSNHVPRKRGFVTRRGHRLILNETPGEDAVELIWHKPGSDPDRTATPARTGDTASIKMNASGIELKDKNSNKVTLDAANQKIEIEDQHGNKLTMSSAGMVLDCGTRNFEVKATGIKLSGQTVDVGTGASHPVAMGDNWLQWALTHTHGTGVGPTTVPVNIPQPTQNSATVKVKT